MTILVRQIRLRCFTLLKILPINFAFAWNKRQRYSDFKFRSSVTRRLSQKPGFRTTHTRPYHHMRIKSFSCLPPATKLRQGNVFTPVCHSVHRGGLPHTYPWADKPPGQKPPPSPGSACWDTVNKRAVRILLECNLVIQIFINIQGYSSSNNKCGFPDPSLFNTKAIAVTDTYKMEGFQLSTYTTTKALKRFKNC